MLLVAACCCAAGPLPAHQDTSIPKSSLQPSAISDEIVTAELAGIPDNAQLQLSDLDVADDDESVRLVSAEQLDDDMDLAETHLFRPLFRYRAQMDDRRRRRINDY